MELSRNSNYFGRVSMRLGKSIWTVVTRDIGVTTWIKWIRLVRSGWIDIIIMKYDAVLNIGLTLCEIVNVEISSNHVIKKSNSDTNCNLGKFSITKNERRSVRFFVKGVKIILQHSNGKLQCYMSLNGTFQLHANDKIFWRFHKIKSFLQRILSSFPSKSSKYSCVLKLTGKTSRTCDYWL